ncbi:NPCBM/NEW2 domain-containing protein [Streptomyces canus]|uniref:NPCBM/NEW2 domain-containing protein n=1 Tax=Streptomyces canus TaxID=58343 RepID=UPI0037101E83
MKAKKRFFAAITLISMIGLSFSAPTSIAEAETDSQGSQVKYLSDIEPLRSEFGVANEAAETGGEQYPHSVVMRADKGYVPYGDAEYNLGRKWRSLDATIGLRDDSPSEAVLKFEVFADGTRLHEERMKIGESSNISLDVSDKLRLTIKVSYASSEEIDDYCYGVWGDARLSADTTASGRVLGGLPDLPSYCKAKGFEDSSDPAAVENVGGWECVSAGRSMSITNDPKSLRNLTWDEACDLFYGVKFGNVRPINTGPTDPPFTVKCVK